MKKALVIGRFQGVHNGHVNLFEQVKRLGVDLVLIGIGHCGELNSRHPFKPEEVKHMLEPVIGMPFKIYHVPDINDPPNYAKHVKSIVKEFDKYTIIVSGNPYTKQCFPENKVLNQRTDVNISATIVRNNIANGNEWKSLVPKTTYDFIKNNNLTERVKRYCK
ncbi:adenylyltransferase/cytidyltransferase family protein [Candidatus Woesearchaeota archaeon]|nr:adenylyltransferase/cytidyltransferase family protein [Candidatus Woesearchaeota archaeon]